MYLEFGSTVFSLLAIGIMRLPQLTAENLNIGILLEVDKQTDQTSASAQPATASASDRAVVADNLALVVFARKTDVLAGTRARTTVRCARACRIPAFHERRN